MTNTPVILPEASAIQWNEYIVFLTKDGTVLLYHIKLKMWTTLSKCTSTVAGGLPLASYRGQITTMSHNGDLVSFGSSQWETVQGLSSTLITEGGYFIKISRAMIIPNNDTLYAVVEWGKDTTQRKPVSGTKKCNALSYDPKSGWTIVHSLEATNLQSAALIDSDLYIWASCAMYRVCLASVSDDNMSTSESGTDQDMKIPTLALPPHQGSTLHAVKGNLFAFGGRDQDNQPSSDVLRYNPGSNMWESAGYMRSSRYNVVVTTVQQDNDLDVLVFGGSFGSNQLSTTKPTCSKYVKGTTQTTAPASQWACPTCIVEKCSVE